jgi:hypothetical protein
MWHVWGAGEMHTGLCWEDLRERDHWKKVVNGRIILTFRNLASYI